MKKTISLITIFFTLTCFSNASGMYSRIICKSPHNHLNQLRGLRKCHNLSADERQQMIQTLEITNGAIRSSLEQNQKRIALGLKLAETGYLIIDANTGSIENLRQPDQVPTVLDTQILCKQFNELTKQLERIGQSFE